MGPFHSSNLKLRPLSCDFWPPRHSAVRPLDLRKTLMLITYMKNLW
jgi:hypothetical protein